MREPGDAAWRAAQRLVGARFRLMGRDPGHGLDCVGVVLIALHAAGLRPIDPAPYALRGGSVAGWSARLDGCGLARCGEGEAGPGAIVLTACGRGQFHLLVRGSASHVHADAGLCRVVETPGAAIGEPLGCWAIPPGGEAAQNETEELWQRWS